MAKATETDPMMEAGNPKAMEQEAPAGSTITLDMTDPAIAEQFDECEPGETLEVVSKDENSIVLQKGAGYETSGETTKGEEEPDYGGGEEEEPDAVAAVINKRYRK